MDFNEAIREVEEEKEKDGKRMLDCEGKPASLFGLPVVWCYGDDDDEFRALEDGEGVKN